MHSITRHKWSVKRVEFSEVFVWKHLFRLFYDAPCEPVVGLENRQPEYWYGYNEVAVLVPRYWTWRRPLDDWRKSGDTYTLKGFRSALEPSDPNPISPFSKGGFCETLPLFLPWLSCWNHPSAYNPNTRYQIFMGTGRTHFQWILPSFSSFNNSSVSLFILSFNWSMYLTSIALSNTTTPSR